MHVNRIQFYSDLDIFKIKIQFVGIFLIFILNLFELSMEEKFAIVLDKIIDPYEFSYRRKNEKNDDAYQKGAIDDVVPADVVINFIVSRKILFLELMHDCRFKKSIWKFGLKLFDIPLYPLK